MSQSAEATYLELQTLVRNPESIREEAVLSKISSWTDYVILADRNMASDVLLYILNKNPYLSVKMMQAAKCYPLHSLAVRWKFTEMDLAVFAKILASRYFDITDLNAEHDSILDLVLRGRRHSFIEVLRQQGLLVRAILKLRERCGGDLIQHYRALSDAGILLMTLPEFEPTESESIQLKHYLCMLPSFRDFSSADQMIRSYIRFVGGQYCRVAMEKGCWFLVTNLLRENPDEVSAEDYDYFIKTIVLTNIDERQSIEVISLLATWIKNDDLRMRRHEEDNMFSQRPLVESLILNEKSAFKRDQLIKTCRTPLIEKINEFLSSPLGKWLLLDDYTPSESDWSSIEAALRTVGYQNQQYDMFIQPAKRFQSLWGKDFRGQTFIELFEDKYPFEWALEKRDCELALHLVQFVKTPYAESIKAFLKSGKIALILELLRYERQHDEKQSDRLFHALTKEINDCIIEAHAKQISATTAMRQTAQYSGHKKLWMFKTVEAMQRKQIIAAEVKPKRKTYLWRLLDVTMKVFSEGKLLNWADRYAHMSASELKHFYRSHRQPSSEVSTAIDLGPRLGK